MRLHWLAIGILTGSALFAQPMPPYPPQGQQGYPPPQANAAPPANSGDVDAPGRAVARLGILNGDASVRRGDSSDWVAAAVNAPLMSGDEISVAAGGRAEIELDASHFLRLGGDTEVRLADLENGHFQVQVAHGLATWRVLRNGQSQGELSTPLVSVRPGALSTVRVEVSPDGASHVTVRKGEADVSTEKGSEKVSENTTIDVRGAANDPEFQVVAAAQHDEWDSWNDQRDAYLSRAQSQRYVTSDVQGVEDLDAYGHWNYDPAYGWVWAPTVAANWAPYQDGQWVWEDYYGWTWVDYAPWGWAPFHYGNWYFRTGVGWAWWPGSRVGHVWWRPAMVGFFGWGGGGVGVGVGFGFGNIGWVPLAPHEVFHPWYGRGFGTVDMVHNVNVVGTFRNASALHGVTAVSALDFQRGNFRNTVAVDRATLSQASLARGALPMTPTSQNLRFSQRSATVGGSAAGQRFFGSTATPAAARRTPFVQQQANVRSEMSRPPSPPQTQNNWNRFQSTPGGGNPAARGPAPANRFTPQQQNTAPQQRQVQVSPQIVRQRPESTPSYTPQARPQAPAPRGESRPAPRGNNNGGRR